MSILTSAGDGFAVGAFGRIGVVGAAESNAGLATLVAGTNTLALVGESATSNSFVRAFGAIGVPGSTSVAGALQSLGNDTNRAAFLREGEISEVHPSLPIYGTRGAATSGTLVTSNGTAYLVSGRGPGSLLFAYYTVGTHVEAHAAAILSQYGLREGEIAHLYINKPNGPCPGPFGCGSLLEDFLPTGAQLHVYWPGGGFRSFVGN